MIVSVIYCSWLILKRDRVALGLSFVLPIVFFSIFAGIFGGMGGGDKGVARPIAVALVDLDESTFSQRFIEIMSREKGLRVLQQDKAVKTDPPPPFTEDSALAGVRSGRFPAALVLPANLQESVGFMPGGTPLKLYYDSANPLARHTLIGLLQAIGMKAIPSMMDQGVEMLVRYGGPLTPNQKTALDAAKQRDGSSEGSAELVPVTAIDARAAGREEKKSKGPDLVAYYAAGIGVMFLLFSMSGAGSGLLEEEESGTLDRLMVSQLGMTRLLLGKWLFFAIAGFCQMALMFTWGALVFGLPLFTGKHLGGFILMTLPTVTAAAAFGLLLATLSRSRAQLSGISTIVILIMSALGGSMVPRFVMPPSMDTAALFTFNGWAIDGYLKIFWRDDPNGSWGETLLNLLPQVGMMLLFTAAFLALALWFARRWRPA